MSALMAFVFSIPVYADDLDRAKILHRLDADLRITSEMVKKWTKEDKKRFRKKSPQQIDELLKSDIKLVSLRR